MGILILGFPSSVMSENTPEMQIDLLLKDCIEIDSVKQEILTIDYTAVFEEIPEIHLLRVKSNSEAVKQEIKKNENVELIGKLSDVFIEDNRLIKQKSLLKNMIIPETVTFESDEADELAILEELAWYKNTMLEDMQILEKSKGQGVQIGLIDSGIDILHPLLSPVVDIAKAKSFVDNDLSIKDSNGHGTMVAGIIAQIAPQTKITPYRVLSSNGGDSFWTLEAMIQAVNDDQDILNMSLGTYKYENIADEKITIESFERAVDYALKNDVVIVSSSGNKGLDLDLEFEDKELRHLPGSVPGVVSTSALTADNILASYSNIGSNIQQSAPGGDYVFVDGQLDANQLIYTSYPTTLDNTLGSIGIPQGYMFSAGTSLAAPCISGILADYISYYKKLTGSSPIVNQIKEDLAFSSIDLGINGKDKLYGYGLPRVKNMYTKVPDKISPTGKFKEQVIEVNEPRTEIDFVTEIQDNSDSEVIVSYLERPKFSELGKQEVKIQLKDNSGNQTILVGTIVIEDTKAPTGIYKNIKVIKGEDIKPEMFVDQVTDNHDSKKVKITFENSVDTNQVGEKEIEIRLSDFSGNFIILKGKLEVLELIETKPNINLAKRESIASSKKISDEKASNNDGDSDKDKNLNSRKSFPNTSEKKVRFSIIGYLLLGVSLCIVSSRYGSEQ
ncbi:S8 family peptidase [Enterococcus rivorum]|nr:S8 family serine peptidase [Enterococcus rivorum]